MMFPQSIRSSILQNLEHFGKFLPSVSVALFVYIVAWISSYNGKIYWTDEIFSLWVTGNGNLSLLETLRLSDSGRDGMMPLFYISSNIWAQLGGEGSKSELWMRLPSLFWTIGGFVFLTLAVRKRFGAVGAGVGVAIGLFCTIAAAQEMAWFRAYGALVGLTGILVAALAIETFRVRIALVYVCNVLLVLYHPYGIFYGGAVTLSPILFSFFNGEWKKTAAYACSLIVPTLFVLFKTPHLRSVSRLGGDGGLWPTPDLGGLIYACIPLSQPILVIFMLVVGGMIASAVSAGLGCRRSKSESRIGEFEMGTVFLLLVPAGIWLLSQWSSFFVIRYFAPMTIFASVAGAFVFSRIAAGPVGRWIEFSLVLLAGYAYFQGNAVMGEDRNARERMAHLSMGKFDKDIFADGRGGQHPVIIEDLDIFLPRAFYNPQALYFFPTRKISAEEDNSQIKTLSQNLMMEHAKSYSETGGRVGINPQLLLDEGRLQTLADEHDTIFFLRNTGKGTGGFALEKLQDQGWTISQIEGSDAFVLKKPSIF